MLKSNFDLVGGKFFGCCIGVQNFKNLLESKPFNTSRKRPYYQKNQPCAHLIHGFTKICISANPINIRTFLKENDSYLEKYKFATRFKSLKLKQRSRNFEQQ